MTGRKEDEPAIGISIAFNIFFIISSLTNLHEMMVVMMVDHGVRVNSIVGRWVHRSSLKHNIIDHRQHLCRFYLRGRHGMVGGNLCLPRSITRVAWVVVVGVGGVLVLKVLVGVPHRAGPVPVGRVASNGLCFAHLYLTIRANQTKDIRFGLVSKNRLENH